MKKKSYNPFKMKGTLIGAILLTIYSFFAFQFMWFDFWDVLINLTGKIWFPFLTVLVTLIVHFILGALLGWLIHCLIRKFRK